MQLLEFSIRHSWLVGALLITISLLLIAESLWLVLGSRAISPRKLSLLMNRQEVQILDLRVLSDFIKGHLPQARSIFQTEWGVLLAKLKPTQPIILIIPGNTPTFSDLVRLRKAGFTELYHLEGGIEAWSSAHLPLV